MKKQSAFEQRNQIKQQLEESKKRLAELKSKGVKALSRYDIEIAHSGDAEGALATAKMLVSNHIRYYENQLKELPQTLFDL